MGSFWRGRVLPWGWRSPPYTGLNKSTGRAPQPPGSSDHGGEDNGGFQACSTLLSILLSALYDAWFISHRGGTPGKLILGLQVIRPNGEAGFVLAERLAGTSAFS